MLIKQMGVAQPQKLGPKAIFGMMFQCLSSKWGLRNPDTFLPLVSAALRGVNSGCLCFCKNICVQIVNMKFSSSFLVSVTR